MSLALVASSLVVPPCVEAQSIVIHPPIITNVVNTPQTPPPGYSVNVTASVNGSPRSIAQVRLVFSSSSNRANRTIEMVLVGGDRTTGLYFGTIPSNVSLSGVTVAYFVIASDSSGFVGTSGPRSFVVEPDNVPPSFVEAYPPVGYLDTPILNFTEVEVRFNVTDSGSGVRLVVVKYSNSTGPTHNPIGGVNLTLAQGDRFNGLWSGYIPPMNNGIVKYEAQAIDFAGNVANSSRSFDTQSYQISPLSDVPPNADIQIGVQNVNLTSRVLTTYLVISSFSPTRDTPESFAAHVDIRAPSSSYEILTMPRTNGFNYLKSRTYNIPIYDVNLWPFDSYFIDIVFHLYAPGLTANNTKVQFFLQGLASLQFDNSTPRVDITKTNYSTDITFQVELTRKPTSIDPIMQVIFAIFFVLGSVAFIRPSNVSRRLELFLGLFTFIVILFYTITPILQSEGVSKIIGSTVPQALLIGLTWSTTFLMGASLAIAYLGQTGCLPCIVRTYHIVFRHAFNFGLAFLALVITWLFSGVFVGLQYNYSSLGVTQVWNAVISGMFLPPMVALVLDLAGSRRILSQILRRIYDREMRILGSYLQHAHRPSRGGNSS